MALIPKLNIITSYKQLYYNSIRNSMGVFLRKRMKHTRFQYLLYFYCLLFFKDIKYLDYNITIIQLYIIIM